MAAVQIEPQSILFGIASEVSKVLTRNGPPKMSDELTAVLVETDFNKPLAIAVVTSGLMQAAAAGGGPNPITGAAGQVRGVAINADIADDIRLNGALVCKDSAAADNIRKVIEGAKAMATNLAPATGTPDDGTATMLNSVVVSTSGATVRASLTIDANRLTSSIAAMRGAATASRAAQSQLDGTANRPVNPHQRKPKKPKDPTASQN